MRYFFLTFFILLGVVLGLDIQSVAALEYQSLVSIPKVGGDASTQEYVSALYILSVSVAAFLALIKIIYGGVQYMLSDIITQKENAKKSITGALLGLVIVLGAAFILQTINPQLLQLNFLQTVENSNGGEGVVRRPNNDQEPALPPLPDIEVGDTMPLNVAATPRTINNFYDTCSPNVVNRIPVSNNDYVLSCDASAATDAQAFLSCSGNTCTCSAPNENRGACVTACQERGPSGTTLLEVTNLDNDRVECTYTVETSAQCQDIPFANCLTSNVQTPGLCDVDQSRVCSVSEQGNTTYFFDFE